MNTFSNQQSGFTLIELLVTIVIISTLAGLSIQSYFIHRDNAYYSVSEQTLVMAKTALQAGKVDVEQFSDEFLWHWQNTAGPVNGGMGQNLIPGFVLPEDSEIYVEHSPNCRAVSCLSDYIYVRNCRAGRYMYWFRLGQGFELTVGNVDAPWDC